MKVLMSSSYWPDAEYLSVLSSSDTCFIDADERYVKQSLRNRSYILSANGPLALSIPVKARNHAKSSEVKIDNSTAWQLRHWRAISSAYGRSAYLLYLEDDVLPLYEKKFDTLVDFNMAQLQTIKKILQLKINIEKLQQMSNVNDFKDHRFGEEKKRVARPEQKQYRQVFFEKFGFVKGMGALDLLLNEGPASPSFL
jgi:hypothetical protein